ncbi:hypothetical protein [Ferroplasma acidarmanus]|jgi:hypothetical protein|uniref:Uncharacterized protein n=1 Tax=Ferroplasma acidarmanus Fer1 TaxID=333146 RepID=S0APA8_FERAC|nr:hypothetical protein [Ferroplasma acidarmanus]AGO60029.1 hypothetical protein FACI_IFERC00001G0049 [Ferroplasma acidarmanus Fer1]HIH59746.1 hypothetical protein [Ferroplasma sp.]
MDYEFNHAVNFIIIVDEPVDIFNLFTRSDDKAFKEAFTFPAPTNNVNQNFSFSAQLNQNFTLKKIIEGIDLAIFNINYGKKIRGAFRISTNVNNSNISSNEQIFSKLKDLVTNLQYTNVFAYEISITGIINYKNYEEFKQVENLQTMSSPKYRSIKIIDGADTSTDLREQYISEIDIEQNVIEPGKSNLLAVYRTPDFHIDSLTRLLADIGKIVNMIR